MSSECDSWMTRQQLELLGVQKLVNEMDSKEAARLGLMTRPLTTAAIEKHLDDFGLEPEFSSHSLMKGLSGGQKVKVVLGAAMWNNPHILVMDEPTNFLDRDSLGALAMVRSSFIYCFVCCQGIRCVDSCSLRCMRGCEFDVFARRRCYGTYNKRAAGVM